jgi:hypothetical protein
MPEILIWTLREVGGLKISLNETMEDRRFLSSNRTVKRRNGGVGVTLHGGP